jgi:serine/threonine protein phosphatase PrpC
MSQSITGHKRVAEEISHASKRVRLLSPTDEKLWDIFQKKALQGIDRATLPEIKLTAATAPLELEIFSAEEQGSRRCMEDAHFHCRIENGFLMGLFDGHGEQGTIANDAAEYFRKSIPPALKTPDPNYKEIFKSACLAFNASVTKPSGGTTALTCYFDATSHHLYVSNLGDSELKVFRKVDDKIYAIPISITRNWGSEKDVKRVEEVFNDKERFQAWLQIKDPKYRYFPGKGQGVNVSRSLGDKSMQLDGKTAISCHPHVDLFQLHEGDLVLMGCDGVWDFVQVADLIENVIAPHWDNLASLPRAIIDFVLKNEGSDNITVICAKAKIPCPDSPLNSTIPYDDASQETQ